MSAASPPLDGVRVVEFAGMGPAPFAAMMLAELGADVVRLDRPGGGVGPTSLELSRSRPNVALDLKQSAGVDVALRLVDGADVVVEGFRPGVMERLGLGPDICLQRNPRLVYGRMTGWGQDGPLASQVGHDITYAAISGALHLMGPPERPVAPINMLADFGGGALYLVIGVLAALHARTGTGRGQVVDAAMVDGAASLVTMCYGLLGEGGWRDERGVNLLDGGAPYYDTYVCADGRFVAVGALEPRFYAALLDGLGLSFDHEQTDPAGFSAQRSAFERTFRTRTRDEWVSLFAGTEACVAPVLSLAEAPQHPHLMARGVFTDLNGYPTPRIAPRFGATPAREPSPPRAAGADTVAYLRSHGFTADEVSALVEEGAVVQT